MSYAFRIIKKRFNHFMIDTNLLLLEEGKKKDRHYLNKLMLKTRWIGNLALLSIIIDRKCGENIN